MKICMFTNTFLPHVGGVARSVSAFAEDLRQRGHKVLVFAPTFPDLKDSDDNPDQVVRVPAIQNFNGSDFSVRIALPGALGSQLDRFQPDIIHSHHPFLLGDAAIRAAHHRGLPVVFTHHTLYERYTHYVSFDSPAMKRFAIELATRFANLCQRVIAPSESVAELLRERGVETPCRVVPTGVATEFFAQGDGERFRTNHDIPADCFVIGHLGRLAKEKNLEYLADAALKSCQALDNAFFLVAGEGPSKTYVEDIFAAAGVQNRLIMVGKLTGDDLRDCYAAMDLYIFSSTSETQGMVLTEAMAAATPVIALDASGAREVVRDRHNGRLLPQKTSRDKYAEAIVEVSSDIDLLARWREAALKTAEEFSRESCVVKLENVYQETLEQQNKEHPALDTWDAIQESLRTEWNLLSSKFGAAIEAVSHLTEDEEDNEDSR